MTTEQLRSLLNNTYGMEKVWPLTYEVDAETYGNVCKDLIDFLVKYNAYRMIPGRGYAVDIQIGRHNGIMFKGVELILKKPDEHKPNT